MTDTTRMRPAVFSPEAVASINRAYEQALDILAAAGQRERMRVALAEHMMRLATGGETDEERLCTLAIIRTLGSEPRPVPLHRTMDATQQI